MGEVRAASAVRVVPMPRWPGLVWAPWKMAALASTTAAMTTPTEAAPPLSRSRIVSAAAAYDAVVLVMVALRVAVAAGEVLDLEEILGGARVYVGFAGGLEVPRVLDSASALVSSGWDGMAGRVLRAGDLV